jgi:cyanophycinase
VVCGGGKTPEQALKQFLEFAGGEKARLVLIPTAAAGAGTESSVKALEIWQGFKPASAVVLHTGSKTTANDPKFVEPLKTATGVWLGGGEQTRLADAYLGTAVEQELYGVLKRGGVIGGTSAGAAFMSKLMIARGNPSAETGVGLDLVPGAVIDQHFLKRNRLPRLKEVLSKHPGHIGLGIDEDTALIIKGREMRVVGESTVTICFAPSESRPARTVELKNGAVHDLTALRRAALARADALFPPKEPHTPEVSNGSLVIVGGGRMPIEITKKFIELAGGPDALIVVLPTANPDPLPMGLGEGSFLARAGAKNVKTLPARTKAEVEAPATLEVLKEAKGVWFGGGRQWRFVDAYAGTKAEPLFHEVLKRGGVIGGSSAGASIQAEYMVRGSPLGNLEMMSEGYERGLGFLPGVAVDQHFTQRNRFKDLSAVVRTFPQILGIGIDEGTALVVRGHEAEIMGPGKTHFFDGRKAVAPGAADYEAVAAGGRYDLKARQALPPMPPK